MKLALDVQYGDGIAAGAAVGFTEWDAPLAELECAVIVPGAAGYEPGSFFKRELPVLRAVLESAAVEPSLLVVDGYVWLAADRPGLGWYLHASLEGRVPVVGVAKSSFAGSPHAVHLLRGESARPLFVTAVGIDAQAAADNVARMAGEHRIPTLLKRVDSLARERLLREAQPPAQ